MIDKEYLQSLSKRCKPNLFDDIVEEIDNFLVAEASIGNFTMIYQFNPDIDTDTILNIYKLYRDSRNLKVEFYITHYEYDNLHRLLAMRDNTTLIFDWRR